MRKYQAMDLGLQDAMIQIDDGRIQLPQFQRSFKWKQAEQAALLDSIQKNYPVGSLLLLEVSQDEKQKNPFAMRGFDGAPKQTQLAKYLVLDGQQRLSTCYRAFSNRGLKWAVINLEELFMNYKNNPGQNAGNFLEMIEFVGKSPNPDALLFSNNRLPFAFLNSRKDLRARLAQYRKNLLEQPETEEFGNFIDVGLESYIDVFFDYQFPCVVLPSDLDLEAVANVFTKINTTGLRLSAFDLCVSTLFPKGIQLREMWDTEREDSLVAALDEDGTSALQTLALLATQPSKKATLFKSITADLISRFWTRTIAGMKDGSQYLSNIGAPSAKTVPYDAIIPTLCAAMADTEVPSSPPKAMVRESQISRWVLQTAFSLRYTEGTDQKREEDFPLIVKYFSEGKVPEFLDNSLVWQSSLMPKISNSGARYKALLVMLNRRNPSDFINRTKKLGIDVIGTASTEIHHVFPRGYFKKLGLDPNVADKAFNMTFLSRESNNFISDRAPSEYIKALESLYLVDLKSDPDSIRVIILELLKPHFIDEKAYEAMLKDDFESFLIARAENVKVSLKRDFQIPIEDTNPIEIGTDEFEDDSEDLG